MSDDLVKQALAELTDVVRCRCHEAYTGRGLHDPDCQCDSAEAVKVVADRIEELEAKLAKAVDASVEAVWAEYTDSIESKWAFRKEHVQNAIARTLAELKGQDDE
jgi:hypothetical protein